MAGTRNEILITLWSIFLFPISKEFFGHVRARACVYLCAPMTFESIGCRSNFSIIGRQVFVGSTETESTKVSVFAFVRLLTRSCVAD